jgi:uncharacterized repeat protein (TIGR03803 family)
MLSYQSRPWVVAVLSLILLTSYPTRARAATESVVHEFVSERYGANPRGNLAVDQSGDFYGTASEGGLSGNGTVFELIPQASGNYEVEVLYSFTGGNDGRGPQSGVTFDAAGNLWGTASYGGVRGGGTVFRLSRENGRWKEDTIYSFGSQDGDGAYPSGLTFDKAGRIFGTNAQGGRDYGTVFMLSKADAGGSIWKESVLYTFSGYYDGSYPVGSLALDDKGYIYGVTEAGGQLCQDQNYCGTAFMLTPPKHRGDAWTESVLHSFGVGGTYGDGFTPLAGVISDGNGNLYGTTFGGGLGGGSSCTGVGGLGCGVVFEISPGSGGKWNETILYEFLGDTDGNSSEATLLLDGNGSLYGTTLMGGRNGCYYGCGTVFELSPGDGGGWTKTIVHTFLGGKDGGNPYGGVIFDSDGNLYGTTSAAGFGGFGNAFKMTPTRPKRWKETVIAGFSSTDGSDPAANLISDAQNNLYGTTTTGGSCGRAHGTGYGCGTVFELVAGADGRWTRTILYDFGQEGDGAVPDGPLVFDQSGNLFGTTSEGAAFGWGSVFELSRQPDGRWVETVLYNFRGEGDGAYPEGNLILDNAGNLYGTTYYGGYCDEDNCNGTVFELSPSTNGWIEAVLYSFTDGADGANPGAGLIFDSEGNLYGTTVGFNNGGSVFELSPVAGGWVENTLYTFSVQSDGGGPVCTLVFDAAGNLYGTTSYGGVNSNRGGTVFELSPSGGHWTESTLYSFTGGADGESPSAGLIFDHSNNFYGTTQLGGANNNGTVFELSPSGSSWTESVLYRFTGSRDGKYPVAGLLLGADGILYGTAENSSENGVVFSVRP